MPSQYMQERYYKGGVRIMKHGLPIRLPVWYKTLTATGKTAICQNGNLARKPCHLPMKLRSDTCQCESCAEQPKDIAA